MNSDVQDKQPGAGTQTARYEQEVTINLDDGGDQTAEEKPVQNHQAEFDDFVKNALNAEISVFYVDYVSHLLQQLASLITYFIVMNAELHKRYIVPALTYFSIHIIVLVVVGFKVKESKIRKLIRFSQVASTLFIIMGLFTLERRLFFIPFLLFTFTFLSQIVLSCLNFADSIDQTFLFKLVVAYNRSSPPYQS